MKRLSLEEAREAFAKGVARARNGNHRYGWNPSAKEQRLVDGYSAVAEAEVAAALGRKWTSDGLVPDAPGAGDVEGGISVRWTPRKNGCLIVHQDEPDEQIVVLVTGTPPDHVIRGWVCVAEAHLIGDWREDVRYPACFVDQKDLHPLTEIP